VRALDTGILLSAINRQVPEHVRAVSVLESLASSDRPWGLPATVIHEFLRIVTHPHATARALSPMDALGFIDSLLESSSARLLTPTAHHTQVIRDVLSLIDAVRGLPPGFETAVLCREHDVRELLSADRAMRAFPFLGVRDPLHGPAWTPDEAPLRRYRRLARRGAVARTAERNASAPERRSP
jgi:predicted nucleic acid-binding protein